MPFNLLSELSDPGLRTLTQLKELPLQSSSPSPLSSQLRLEPLDFQGELALSRG